MPKIIFNESGLPVGMGDGGTDLTQSQWQEFLANPGKRRWNGSSVEEYTAPFDEEVCAGIIKSIAGRVIITIAPEYKQRNMTARSVEIADAKAQGTATEADIAESEVIRAIWARIKGVRAKSNELEAQYIAAGNNLAAEDLETIRAALEAAGS